MSIDWGDAPTWVAGVFAAAAAYYTRGMLKSQRQQIDEQRDFIAEQAANLELERSEFRALAAERRQAQAAKIRMEPKSKQDRPGPNDPWTEWWMVHIQNRSAEPVHDVVVRFGEAHTALSAFHGNDHQGRGVQLGVPLPVLAREGTAWFKSSSSTDGSMPNAHPVVYFTDNENVRWRLDRYGDLVEAPPEQNAG
ncbi:hypothetical protein [Streptomyces tanashiensis]|uniref:hypothetical protein n=1 Tax=Streptomyces tanashiensis TaxID=67367 RepID=UPI0033DFB19D